MNPPFLSPAAQHIGVWLINDIVEDELSSVGRAGVHFSPPMSCLKTTNMQV